MKTFVVRDMIAELERIPDNFVIETEGDMLIVGSVAGNWLVDELMGVIRIDTPLSDETPLPPSVVMDIGYEHLLDK
jgi:hypothetical protein